MKRQREAEHGFFNPDGTPRDDPSVPIPEPRKAEAKKRREPDEFRRRRRTERESRGRYGFDPYDK